MSNSPTSLQGDSHPGASPDGEDPYVPPPEREDEVSILDALLVITRNRRLIAGIIGVCVLLGGAYVLSTPEEYRTTAKVVRETQTGDSQLPVGGLSALRGLGFSMGSGGDGLTASAFPDVLGTRDVRLAVARDTFSFPGVERPMTVVEYVQQPPTLAETISKYTLRLPWTIKNALGRALSGGASDEGASPTPNDSSRYPTSAERSAAGFVGEMVATEIEDGSNWMLIHVTAKDPDLAAAVAQSFVDHLRSRVRGIRTAKVRRQLTFLETRFEEVQSELETAEERLAEFLDRNQNPTTPSLRFQRDRLQRQVSFKEKLYSDLQSQLTQTRLDLQRQRPVVTVVEQAIPPTQPNSPRTTIAIAFSIALGGVLALLVVFVKVFVQNAKQDPEEEQKVKELQQTLHPQRIVRRFRASESSEST